MRADLVFLSFLFQGFIFLHASSELDSVLVGKLRRGVRLVLSGAINNSPKTCLTSSTQARHA